MPGDPGASAIPWCKQIPEVFVYGLARHHGLALKVLSALCLDQCRVLATSTNIHSLAGVPGQTSIPSLSKLRGFAVHPTTDWPGTYAEFTVESQAQSLVVHGDGSSSASSIGSLADASEQRFQA